LTSFIFIVTPETFKLCIKKGVCGCPRISSAQPEARGLADISGIRHGSKILFFIKGTKEIYGIYKAKTFPFFDDTQIWDDPEHIFPYRVLIEPTLDTFEKPIFLSDLYDLADKGLLWSWRRIVKRSVQPFTDAETSLLLKLFYRNNRFGPTSSHIETPYNPTDRKPLPIKLKSNSRGRIITPGAPEGHLTAWLMNQLANRKLKEFFGDYNDYINFVPTSYGKEMDVLLLNEIKNSLTGKPIVGSLASCTIVEVKAGKCKKSDLIQTLKYEDWLIKKKCAGDSAMVHSAILAHSFDDEVSEYVKKRSEMEGKEVILLKYSADAGNISLTSIMQMRN